MIALCIIIVVATTIAHLSSFLQSQPWRKWSYNRKGFSTKSYFRKVEIRKSLWVPQIPFKPERSESCVPDSMKIIFKYMHTYIYFLYIYTVYVFTLRSHKDIYLGISSLSRDVLWYSIELFLQYHPVHVSWAIFTFSPTLKMAKKRLIENNHLTLVDLKRLTENGWSTFSQAFLEFD